MLQIIGAAGLHPAALHNIGMHIPDCSQGVAAALPVCPGL